MILYKSFLPIALALALGGCAGNYQSTDISSEAADLQKKAIVITKMNVPLKSKTIFGSDRDHVLRSYWHRVGDAQGQNQLNYEFSRNGFFADQQTDQYHEHMIEPGTYVLDELTYKDATSRLITTYTMEMKITPKITFTVKPGEVVYIGDIQAGIGLSSVQFTDSYDKAVAYFNAAHPEIKTQIQKRLLSNPDRFDVLINSLKDKIKLLEEAKKANVKK